MEERTYSSQLKEKIGQKVTLWGRLYAVRKMGGITFVVLQDRDGLIQAVFEKEPEKIRAGSIIKLSGLVRQEVRAPGGVEMEGEELSVLNETKEDYPFDLSKKELRLNINTLLDHRPLSLRHESQRDLFRVYGSILEGYRRFMREEKFTEVKTPKIAGAAAEGGTNLFSVNYFGKRAVLSQSPQLYKQILAGVYENVFEVGSTFRAEKHFTSRHVNEMVMLDAEMAFIDSEYDVMKKLEGCLRALFGFVESEHEELLKNRGVEKILFPEKEFPAVPLAEMKKLIKEEYGHEVPADTDIDPEGERLTGQYAKEKFNSDFIFLTEYPVKDRPFYTMPGKDGKTKSFDLIFRGIEISSGAQRIHEYEMLVENIKRFELNPDDFAFYLEAFKFAMPPHGGWGLGSERLLYKLFNLDSVKEAILFPRDVKRLEP